MKTVQEELASQIDKKAKESARREMNDLFGRVLSHVEYFLPARHEETGMSYEAVCGVVNRLKRAIVEYKDTCAEVLASRNAKSIITETLNS